MVRSPWSVVRGQEWVGSWWKTIDRGQCAESRAGFGALDCWKPLTGLGLHFWRWRRGGRLIGAGVLSAQFVRRTWEGVGLAILGFGFNVQGPRCPLS